MAFRKSIASEHKYWYRFIFNVDKCIFLTMLTIRNYFDKFHHLNITKLKTKISLIFYINTPPTTTKKTLLRKISGWGFHKRVAPQAGISCTVMSGTSRPPSHMGSPIPANLWVILFRETDADWTRSVVDVLTALCSPGLHLSLGMDCLSAEELDPRG